ncbi:MAG: bifunctional DNA-formamidopyrimidine glycosylase/DNA-(apurinic or apyrimidinic site) lyase [Solirubrobacteraceae bacterium]
MPELPEVETIVRQLAPRVEGRRLDRVEVLDARWCRPLAPAELTAALRGRSVERLWRRGKYLVWDMGEVSLLMHLRMTGTVLYDSPTPSPHTRARIELEDGHRLAMCDPRRFGTAELAWGTRGLEHFFASRLGVEPLGPRFTHTHLRALARGRRAPVKAFLLDQRRVAGVGNIYADEALFRARIHPLRPAGQLTARQVNELHQAVVSSLHAGIVAGGATIDDYRDVDGLRGGFQDQFLVHRRAGEPCPRCGATIVKLLAAGRGTYACERCQPRPRRRRPPAA